MKVTGNNTTMINCKVYKNLKGSVSIIGDKVFCEGKLVEPSENSDKEKTTIIINGDIDNIDIESAEEITVNGSVNKVNVSSGNLKISGNVTGNVNNNTGNIKCGNVNGNVKTSCGNISYIKS